MKEVMMYLTVRNFVAALFVIAWTAFLVLNYESIFMRLCSAKSSLDAWIERTAASHGDLGKVSDSDVALALAVVLLFVAIFCLAFPKKRHQQPEVPIFISYADLDFHQRYSGNTGVGYSTIPTPQEFADAGLDPAVYLDRFKPSAK
jgi:hypothetical protein